MNKIFQSLTNLASQGVGLVSINRVSFSERGCQEFVHKKRIAIGWILIVPGNLVFRFRVVPVMVLYKREWMRWERDVRLVTLDEDVTLGRTLVCRKIPGESLLSLINVDTQYSEKIELLSIATESLNKFHATTILVSGVGSFLLSHGDAWLANVLYDSNTKLATWFDFDLRHDLRCEATSRHADDLRSLLFSAVHLFDVDSIEDWIQTQRVAYPSDEVWSALAKQISGRWFAFDFFHHAQMARARRKCGLSVRMLGRLDCKLTQAILNVANPRAKTGM